MGVMLDKCPCISGFIDGVKECVPNWLHKIYTDVSIARSPADLEPNIWRGTHFDVDQNRMLGYEEEDPRWPFVLYFSLSAVKPVKLMHQPCPGERGRAPELKQMKIPALSVLVFDVTGFEHGTCPKSTVEEEIPDRLNILIHGIKEIQHEDIFHDG